MTITYLIGNGFDLGLKLKTDYKSFIDWYLAKKDVPPELDWLRREMRKYPNQWSDAEIAFGKLKFSEHGKPIDVYNKCYDDFSDAFNAYLVERNKLFEIPELDRRKVAEEFVRRTLCVHEYMAPQCRQFYLDSMKNQSINLNFITFNYTNTLEKILNFHADKPDVFEIKLSDEMTMKVLVKNVCHVHGTLDDAYVFGIDSPSQIEDAEVRRYCERNGGMLKARADEKLGLLNRSRGMSLLKHSNRIVTYGLSFGESDASWWQALFSEISTNRAQLVMCPFRADLLERLSAKKRSDVYLEEKRRVFNSLVLSNPKLVERIEEFSPPAIMSLRPSKSTDARGNIHHCDYFHLSALAAKYTKEV